jgi:hypothetical protein
MTKEQEISKWLNSKKPNYEEGILLYSKYSKNKFLLRHFSHGFSEKRLAKLIYVLEKEIGFNVEPANSIHVEVKPKRRPQGTTALQSHKTFNKLPLIIQELIKQRGTLYRHREMWHSQLKEIPQDNKKHNKDMRKVLAAKIDHVSKRIDVLYVTLDEFNKSGKLPSEDILNWKEDVPVKKKKADNLPDHTDMTPLQLKNRLNNLRTYVIRDENLVNYQDRKKAAKPNPMPKGPKRTQLEKKIELRKQEIRQIEELLKKSS